MTNSSHPYCPHCREPIADPRPDQECPHCGLTLSDWHEAATIVHPEDPTPGLPDSSVDGHNPLIGQRLVTYDVEAFCGAGGMARVYRARHVNLHRLCALKVLDPFLARRQPAMVESFLAEARAAAALVHPHVVTVHTIGEDRGIHFIEMEYVPGQSLAHVARSVTLDVTRATRFMVQIGGALAEAHRLRLVHRDIKPANVLVAPRDLAKLADFGLAKHLHDDALHDELGITGTPHFMAPELFECRPATARSDIYAMGVTYFALLTGRVPFSSESLLALFQMHATATVPDVRLSCSQAGEEIAEIIQRCMAKHPADRYADAEELYEALHAAYLLGRSLESLLQEGLADESAQITPLGEDRFLIRVALGDGRSQRVRVEAAIGEAVTRRIVRVFSVCGPADENYFRRALELNSSIAYGALALEDCAGQTCFVMVHTHPRASCDPEELRESVMSIARHADEIEQALTGDDQN
jgi:eukaryotic-like serine/threonine-protein kinase